MIHLGPDRHSCELAHEKKLEGQGTASGAAHGARAEATTPPVSPPRSRHFSHAPARNAPAPPAPTSRPVQRGHEALAPLLVVELLLRRAQDWGGGGARGAGCEGFRRCMAARDGCARRSRHHPEVQSVARRSAAATRRGEACTRARAPGCRSLSNALAACGCEHLSGCTSSDSLRYCLRTWGRW